MSFLRNVRGCRRKVESTCTEFAHLSIPPFVTRLLYSFNVRKGSELNRHTRSDSSTSKGASPHSNPRSPPLKRTPKIYTSLVTIRRLDYMYKFRFTMAFQKALDDNETAVTLHYAHPPPRTRRSPTSTTLK